MKKRRFLAILLLIPALILGSSCESLTGEQAVEDQFVDVIRGDLTVAVSGTGNIEVSEDRQLTFSTSGKIDRILVEEGDAVEAGDMLAELDRDALELAVTQAETALVNARVAVSQARVAVSQARLAADQAQYSIDSAQYDLDFTESNYLWTEVSAAQGEVADAQDFLDNALTKLAQAPPGSDSEISWQKAVFYAELRLKTAKDRVNALLAGTDTAQIALKRQQITLAEENLAQQELALELAIESEKAAVQSEELARRTLANAEKQLENTVLTAPFSGTITDVYANEGDAATPAAPVFRLIDASRMELNVDVDEIDIAQVKPGQTVLIELDALPDLVIEGSVASIHDIPVSEGGVILYRVKIEFSVPEDAGVRNGMSANGDIVIDKSAGTLIVPARAVRRNARGDSVVEVLVDAETEETGERTVVTGISDGFQTEILSGLTENDVVLERR